MYDVERCWISVRANIIFIWVVSSFLLPCSVWNHPSRQEIKMWNQSQCEQGLLSTLDSLSDHHRRLQILPSPSTATNGFQSRTPSLHWCGRNFFLCYTQAWCRNLTISAKKVFFKFRVVKNKFYHSWPPLEKLLEKSTSGPSWKIPSAAHAHNKHVKLHHFCKIFCCITPPGNTVQQHHAVSKP